MPILLPASARAALTKSVNGYAGTLGEDFTQQALDRLLGGIQSILNPTQEERGAGGLARAASESGRSATTTTVGATPATVQGDLADLLKRFENPQALAEELNLDFKIKIATEVAQGAQRHIADNFDQAELDAFPALELLRVYDRDVPRGDEPKGVREDNDWPSRWEFAATESGDTDAARILKETGRMIALKASPLWQSLGDGAGNYDDTLGNPYPPFAFNSGMDVDGVSRQECLDLGLIQEGDQIEPAEIDFNNLFNMEEAA